MRSSPAVWVLSTVPMGVLGGVLSRPYVLNKTTTAVIKFVNRNTLPHPISINRQCSTQLTGRNTPSIFFMAECCIYFDTITDIRLLTTVEPSNSDILIVYFGVYPRPYIRCNSSYLKDSFQRANIDLIG
ncbi:hypothetical protein PTT_19899 [Pyrenophora teres f. teres 0-1]|uniref:Secreted protein n=1 Tax=Pyrenophora teres f. teres (strain 0-1) TaxID=861557 RepID=E3S9Y8_PYRTT|nr:hypothetical protein PTT_19899 [Pyrenophora teres f. teres 0-1]